MKLTQTQLLDLAAEGATVRARALAEELAAISRQFPNLDGVRVIDKRRARPTRRAKVQAKPRRPRMTRAAREAISDRMRKYWAERRKKKGNGKAAGE